MISEILDYFGQRHWNGTLITFVGLFAAVSFQLRNERKKTKELQRENDELKERLMSR